MALGANQSGGGTVARLGVRRPIGYFRICSLAEGGCVAWMLRLVKIGVEGEGPCTDIMEIRRPDDLVDIANLGLTLAEAKLLLAGVQREIVAAQARGHAVRRPECPRCDGVCRVKDYRGHAVSTLFGPVTLRLPRFRCAVCGGIEAGIAWPAHCRSTPELGPHRQVAVRDKGVGSRPPWGDHQDVWGVRVGRKHGGFNKRSGSLRGAHRPTSLSPIAPRRLWRCRRGCGGNRLVA